VRWDVPTQEQQIVTLLAQLKPESGMCLLFVSTIWRW